MGILTRLRQPKGANSKRRFLGSHYSRYRRTRKHVQIVLPNSFIMAAAKGKKAASPAKKAAPKKAAPKKKAPAKKAAGVKKAKAKVAAKKGAKKAAPKKK